MNPDLSRFVPIVVRLPNGVYVAVNCDRMMGLVVWSHPPLSECGELRFRERKAVAA